MKLIVAGDLYIKKSSDFSFDTLKEKIDAADYFLLNFESPIVDNDGLKPIQKSGPNMSMLPSPLGYLSKYKQKLILSGANNHFGDYGEGGVFSTLKFFKQYSLSHVGCGQNIEDASKPIILNDDLAILAIAENEFGLANEMKAGGNPLRVETNIIQIQNLIKDGYRVLIYFHGGNEDSPIPNPFIKRLYRSFIDAGACVVVGNHTHCPQGYETYGNGIIFYSLGNFIFEKSKIQGKLINKIKKIAKAVLHSNKNDFWHVGYSLELDFSGKEVAFQIIPTKVIDNTLVLLKDVEKQNFINYLHKISDILNDHKTYIELWNTWTNMKSKFIQNKISTFSYNNISQDPSLFLVFKNFITCESHRELLTNVNNLIQNGTLKNYDDHKKIHDLQNLDKYNIKIKYDRKESNKK